MALTLTRRHRLEPPDTLLSYVPFPDMMGLLQRGDSSWASNNIERRVAGRVVEQV